MQGSGQENCKLEKQGFKDLKICEYCSPRLFISIFHGCMLLVFDGDTQRQYQQSAVMVAKIIPPI